MVVAVVEERMELRGPRLDVADADELDDAPTGVFVVDSLRTTNPLPELRAAYSAGVKLFLRFSAGS